MTPNDAFSRAASVVGASHCSGVNIHFNVNFLHLLLTRKLLL